MKHELKGNTLIREAGGIVAECTCGWKSPEHFSTMITSLAFEDHCLAEIGASKTGEGEDDEWY